MKYWVWLASGSGIGVVAAGALVRRFGTPEKVYLASEEEYRNIDGIRTTDLQKLARKDIAIANKILASCDEIGCRIITQQDAEYPDRLRNIYDPPLVLYIRGKMPVIDEEAAVAIVGTRNCTPYGLTAAEDISYRLARRGLLVVTGLARGIDTAAARGALRGGGAVVGVIGSGLDVVYPPENRSLFDDVAHNGAIISEYPPGTPPISIHFPARNRILSGLSLGVAVLEAPTKSGALITATNALEQGRDVFAMPGNINAKNSEGSNALLRDGAIPLLSGDNIADEYAELYPDKIIPFTKNTQSENNAQLSMMDDSGDTTKQKADAPATEPVDVEKITSALDGDEKTVATTIGTKNMHIDEIIIKSGLPASKVLTAITMLEIKGHAQRGIGQYYRLT